MKLQLCPLANAHMMLLCAASQVLDPVARDKISDLLPASEASFEELRSANTKLRASDAYLEESNSKSIIILEAAETKLKQLFPVSQIFHVHLTLHHVLSRMMLSKQASHQGLNVCLCLSTCKD